MRISLNLKKLLSTTFIVAFMIPSANAQLLKRLQKSAERTVEKKLERKTEKETGKIMDSILDPSQKSSPKKTPSKTPNTSTTNTPATTTNDDSGNVTTANSIENTSDGLEVYSKFDFVPGDKVLFYDDFSQDFIGDFPAKWNTNGSGEVVKINNVEGNWFEMKPGYDITYIPDLKNLPEDYTIEFDILTLGLSNKTLNNAILQVILSGQDNLSTTSKDYITTSIPLAQHTAYAIGSKNYFDSKKGSISSSVTADIRKTILNNPHIAIAVTKNRFRLWINETKHMDIPRMIEKLDVLNFIKFNVNALKINEERIFISNLRVADGGEDLRRKLLSEGKISTNGILFDSGSANIKPQSMGIVLQISQVLRQDENIRLNIVGHTDADGNSDNNLKLSKNRAESVKNALVNLYNISADRLETDGKGSEVPVAENSTADGKAQNRRVEFIKI